jgi:hypothetical protein
MAASATPPRKPLLLPTLLALVSFLLVGVPWYLLVLLRDPQRQWHTWFREVSGGDAPDRVDPVFLYAVFAVVMLFPWILFWLGGAWMAATEAAGRPQPPTRRGDLAERWVYVLALVVVPIVIMAFHKDRKERYVLPMAAPAAVLAARCLIAYLAERSRNDWVPWLHWGILAAVAIGLPILGATGMRGLRTVEGRPWYTPTYAAGAAVIAALLVTIGILAWRRGAVLLPTFALMLAVSVIFMRGYRETPNGRSEMRPVADRVLARYPDAEMYTSLPSGQRASVDLSIYMNRPTGWITAEQMRQPAPGPRPQVVLVRQREREPAPTPPEGWEELMTLQRDDAGGWRVWGRPGVVNPSVPHPSPPSPSPAAATENPHPSAPG